MESLWGCWSLASPQFINKMNSYKVEVEFDAIDGHPLAAYIGMGCKKPKYLNTSVIGKSLNIFIDRGINGEIIGVEILGYDHLPHHKLGKNLSKVVRSVMKIFK